MNLTTQWSLNDRQIVLDYAVANASGKSALVFDLLVHVATSGAITPDPTLAFVEVTSRGELQVSKVVPAVPEDRDIESPYMPYARMLEAGATLVGRAVIDLPIAEWHAYRKSRQDSAADFDLDSPAGFRIGYALVDDELDAKSRDIGGRPAVMTRYGWAATRQRYLTASVGNLRRSARR